MKARSNWREPSNSQVSYAETLRRTLGQTTAWLDLGCGHQYIPDWLPEHLQALPIRTCRTVGIDTDHHAICAHPDLRLKIVGDVEHLPVKEASFDLITANMVLEHVREPERLFLEVGRVLKPGGVLLIHTPNLQGYTTMLTRCLPSGIRPAVAKLLQGRETSDVYPTFYRANTVEALREAANRAKLSVLQLQRIESSPQLFRVPLVRTLEQQLLILLRRESLARWRPCILASFTKD